ncbi:Ribosomal protein L9/RNase H1, N-terminal [Sesbania bispinosa]|nr:Ribosomal protein L9/RNase H1, N-terminal [Sesbania bispinosa]
MSTNSKFYVVFEGRSPGIYDLWIDYHAQVSGFKLNMHKSYETYAKAEAEYVSYCTKKGRDPGLRRRERFTQRWRHGSKTAEGWESSSSKDVKPRDLAEDTSSDQFIVQHGMQNLLNQACNSLGIAPPTYTMHEMRTQGGQKLCRYYRSLATDAIGRPVVSMGRFAKTAFDAREDVAVLLLRRLLAGAGLKIRDFNHYNTEILEEKINKLMDENFELGMENCALPEELRRTTLNG